MKGLLSKFWKDEEGATIMEYILMVAVGAGIIALVFPFIKRLLNGFVERSAQDMQDGITEGTGGLNGPAPSNPN